jgi:cytochrome d ubiquinol oxidase subunit I
MDWAHYSTFVGNIFGAPLAIEALLAFFMESTFIGVWIFGRGRVSPRIHLASIWLASLGTMLSACFILAANAWMQHPVGFKIEDGQAVMTNFWAVITNSTFFGEYFHVVFGALLTAAVFMLAIAAWHLRRGHEKAAFAKVARIAIVAVVIAGLGTIFLGDTQARQMDTQQPMKMAAAEAVYHTSSGASFSLLTIGDLTGNPVFQIRIPHALSVLATNSWNGKVQGIDELKAQYAKKYGGNPNSYVPVLWVTYWSFRLMVGLGFLLLGLGAFGLWLMRRKRLEDSSRFLRFASWMLLAPFLANSFGWIFTEMGRQPWLVYGLLKTSDGVSGLAPGYVATSLIGFTAIYSFLAVIEIGLMIKTARTIPTALDPETADRPLELVY